ncbi:efflux RND transporter periplasmic adaptor subunit [Rhodobacterales bacterium HKCCE3408]|nr:efflux RND transporter periplasmic adaptor subunit [Rhodobacterales bacterium HKCCE3408]
MTLVFLVTAGVAVREGTAFLSSRAEAAATAPETDPIPVETRPLVIEDGYTSVRSYLGRIEPPQSSALSFELAGRVTEILVDEGDTVAEGDVIARLDTAILDTDRTRLEAARAALSADLALAERQLTRRETLQASGFAPEEQLDQARFGRDALVARIAETDAQLAAIDVQLDKSVLRAPFSGTVAARTADTGATLSPGQPVVELLQDGPARLRVGLPLWLTAETGARFDVTVDGVEGTAVLTALRPDIDTLTRTRTALLTLEDQTAPYGATATVEVPREIAARGAWVPFEALREGAPGVWSILVVDDENVVRAAPVEVLHAEADRVFLGGGLTDGLALVTGGPHRVVPGQTVALIAGN